MSEAGQVAKQRGKLSAERGRGEDETSETVSGWLSGPWSWSLVSPAYVCSWVPQKMLCHASKFPLLSSNPKFSPSPWRRALPLHRRQCWSHSGHSTWSWFWFSLFSDWLQCWWRGATSRWQMQKIMLEHDCNCSPEHCLVCMCAQLSQLGAPTNTYRAPQIPYEPGTILGSRDTAWSPALYGKGSWLDSVSQSGSPGLGWQWSWSLWTGYLLWM